MLFSVVCMKLNQNSNLGVLVTFKLKRSGWWRIDSRINAQAEILGLCFGSDCFPLRSFPTQEYTIVEKYFEINWDIIRRYSRHLFFEKALSPTVSEF